MKKYVNVLCVLILALMFFDLVWGFYYTGESTRPTTDPKSLSMGTSVFLLVTGLVALAALVTCFISFIKFILNVNRNEVFNKKNISLLRKYGVCAIVCGVCICIINSSAGFEFGEVIEDSCDAISEGLFALLMGEIISIGMKLEEKK